MNYGKTILTLTLAVLLTLSLTACNQDTKDPSAGEDKPGIEAQIPNPSTDEGADSTNEGNGASTDEDANGTDQSAGSTDGNTDTNADGSLVETPSVGSQSGSSGGQNFSIQPGGNSSVGGKVTISGGANGMTPAGGNVIISGGTAQ